MVGRGGGEPGQRGRCLSSLPQSSDGVCSDCGTTVVLDGAATRCPACFDRQLFDLDAGFLESYRKFGARSRIVVAETCLRGLVLATPDQRKILAMTIFEQYFHSMNDLAGLFLALRNRHNAPILRSFSEFRLDASNAVAFFDAVDAASDVALCASLDLPLPGEVALRCSHLDRADSESLAVAIRELVRDLRKTTDRGNAAALALAELNGRIDGALVAPDAAWLNGAATGLTPDQVAMLVLDSKRGSLHIQGLSADENAMGQVVDAIDTATRAASNLIYAYLQTNDL